MAPVKPRFQRTLLAVSLLSVLTVSWGGGAIHADRIGAGEYEIKAAYLFNFAKFVEWPPSAFAAADSFVIGLLGDDPFGPDLEKVLSGKSVQDKRIVLKRIKSVAEGKECQILFIAPSEESDLQRILRSLEREPVLVVSDINAFIQRGGMVGLTIEAKKVRFSVNKGASDAAQLKLSAQLLKLAKEVTESPSPEGP